MRFQLPNQEGQEKNELYFKFILIVIFSSFMNQMINQRKDLPPRFDFSKGINLKTVIPKSMNDKLYSPVPENIC